MVIPEIGDKITFTPTAYINGFMTGSKGSNESREHREKSRVTGKIVHINMKNRWFRVAYETDFYGTQHECFKF